MVPSTVIFTDSYTWAMPGISDAATVTVTVTEDAPGYEGKYLWNYHLVNDAFDSGMSDIGMFDVRVPDPTSDPSAVADLGNSMGWSGSVGVLLDDPELVSWQGGEWQSQVGVGQSADFWFTTLPTAVILGSGDAYDAGFAGGAAGALAVPAPALLVTTAQDVVANDGETSLREAVNVVNGPGNLAGVYRVAFKSTLAGTTITLSPNQGYGQLQLSKDIFIDGPASGITIQRDSSSITKHRIFDVDPNVSAKLANLTIRNGDVGTTEGGGAVRSSGNLTVENCTFAQNSAVGSRGGAIAALAGRLTITGSSFTGNSATYGGAIYIGAEVSATIISSSLVLNTAVSSGAGNGYGGGIYISSSTTGTQTRVVLATVEVNGNSASDRGGGIYVDNPTGVAAGTRLTLQEGTTVQNNQVSSTSGKGGGIYFGSGQLILDGASITDNTAATGPSIFRLDTGTTLTTMGEDNRPHSR